MAATLVSGAVGAVSGVVSVGRWAKNSVTDAVASGAIDVIVVEQADGTLLCTPFHVRFGKLQLLRSREKRVKLRVNDADLDAAQSALITMRLGSAGEAYFVEKLEADAPRRVGYEVPYRR